MKGVQSAESDWFRTTLYSIGDGVVATDREGRILHMNPTAEALSGWPEAEARGKDVREVLRFVSEITGEEVQNPVQIVMDRGASVGLANHTLLIARDGTKRPVADSAAPIREPAGTVEGIVLVIRDQTAEREAERALTESEQKYRLLFERMAEGVAVHEVVYGEGGLPVDYVILGVNPSFERQTGVSAENVVGRRASDAYGAGEPPYLETYSRVASTGFPESFETYFPPLGKHFHVTVYSPEVGRFATVFEDCTERIAAQKALAESERRYRSLFEHMTEGFAYCRLLYRDGEPYDFEYIEVNEACRNLTGIDSFVGRRVSQAVPGILSTNPEIVKAFAQVVETGVPLKLETFVEQLGGWFAVSVYKVEGDTFVTVFENITDRKSAETALVESESRYRKLFDEATEGIALTDPKTGQILDCNQAFLRLVGYRKADLLGKHSETVLPVEAGAPPRSAYGLGAKKGHTVHAKARTKAGVIKDVEVKESLMELDGRIVVQSFFRDVSEELRIRVERETTLGLLRLLNDGDDPRALIESVTRFLHDWTGCEAVAIRLKDADDYPYYATSGFPAKFVKLETNLCARNPDGSAMKDQAGNPVLDCMCGNVICGRFDPKQPFFTPGGTFWTNSTTDLLATSTEEDRQARTRNRCHGEGYESVALIPLRQGGKNLGLLQINDHARGRFTPELIAFLEHLADQIAVALAQKLSAKALQDSEQRLRLTVRATGVGLFDWEVGTNRVHYAPEWVQQLGYGPNELADDYREWLDRLHPEDAEAAVAKVEAYLADPWPTYKNEFRLRHKDGSYRWILALASLTADAAGKPEHILGCHIDITDRKRAERETADLNTTLERRVHERTVALEAANSELQAFAYSISHDLRAPLRGIDGLAAILAEDYGALLGSEGQAICHRINENARRMAQLIDDLLAYSRLGRADVRFQEVDMRALAFAAYREVSAEADPERLHFSVDDLPLAKGDPTLLKQVWVNLVGNAVKFTSKRDVAVIEVGGATKGDEHIFYVRDNGAGFDMQYSDKLFGVFQRLHAAGEFDGTGVGLAIVQRVVHRHGGRTWAVGEVDRGATVYFSIPAR